MGSCTAGGAYVPAMCDQSMIVQGTGTIFLAGPPLVKAATGEEVTAEELGGGDVHARISGVADALAELGRARAGAAARGGRAGSAPLPALATRRRARGARLRPGRAAGVIPADERTPFDVREVIARHRRRLALRRVQAALRRHARVRLRAHLGLSRRDRREQRHPLLGVGAQGRRTSCSSPASARSRSSSCRTSRASWSASAYEHGGIAKDGAKLVMAVACAQVPKLTVVIGGSYGAGNYGMCGRAYRAPAALHVAERAHLGDGRAPGRRDAADGPPRRAAGARRGPGRGRARGVHAADRRPSTSTRARPTTPARGSGTTASSTRSTRAACSRSASPPPRARPSRAALRRLPHVRRRRASASSGAAPRAWVWLDRPERHNALRRGADRARSRETFTALGGGRGAARRRARRPRPLVLRRRATSTGCAPRSSCRRARTWPTPSWRRRCSRPSTPAPCRWSRACTARPSAAAPASPAAATSCSPATDARFGFTEVRLGLVPATIAPVRARQGRAEPGARALPHGRALRRAARARDRPRARAARPTTQALDAAVERVVAALLRAAPLARAPPSACSRELRDGTRPPQWRRDGPRDRRAPRLARGQRGHRAPSSRSGAPALGEP